MKILFCLLVAFHAVVVIANIALLFIVPFVAPFYISLPIDTLLVNLMFSPTPCPLTRLEGVLRRKLGMPEIRHFVGHYFIHPVRKAYRKRYRRV